MSTALNSRWNTRTALGDRRRPYRPPGWPLRFVLARNEISCRVRSGGRASSLRQRNRAQQQRSTKRGEHRIAQWRDDAKSNSHSEAKRHQQRGGAPGDLALINPQEKRDAQPRLDDCLQHGESRNQPFRKKPPKHGHVLDEVLPIAPRHILGAVWA